VLATSNAPTSNISGAVLAMSDLANAVLATSKVSRCCPCHIQPVPRVPCNMVALVDGTPKQLALRDFFKHFLEFRWVSPWSDPFLGGGSVAATKAV